MVRKQINFQSAVLRSERSSSSSFVVDMAESDLNVDSIISRLLEG